MLVLVGGDMSFRAVRGAVRRHPFLASAFALALVLTVLFTARTVMFSIYWADPANRDRPVEGWMTPRYVAHSWQVPPEVVAEALRITAEPGQRRTLSEIAAEAGVPLEDLAERLEASIAEFRAAE